MNTYENCVIGTVLRDPAAMETAGHLRPSDFTGANQVIWGEILALHHRDALGPRALIESLRTSDQLDSIGSDSGDLIGEDYVAMLTTFADSATVEEFVRQVEDASIKRQLGGLAGLLLTQSKFERHSDQILDEAEQRIYSLRRTNVETGSTLGDIMDIFVPRMDGIRSGNIRPAWVPSVEAVRQIVDYVDDSDFVIVAGRPGEGKSSYSRWEALQLALAGRSVLTFNLENDELEYAKFAIAAHTGIDSARLKNPRLLSARDVDRVRESAQVLSGLPWRILTMARPTVAEIDRAARKLHITQGFDLMQVDYIQLISNGIENRVEDVSVTSSTLRATALRLKEPVLAACQLSRAIEYRKESSNPQLSDLRESGSLEQDSTQVWTLRSLWPNPPTSEQIRAAGFPENFSHGQMLPVVKAIPMRVHVLKNRNGPLGVSDPIKWIKATGVFQTLTREDGQGFLRGRDNGN